MHRINVFLHDYQIKFIKSLPQTITEIIRSAVDDFIEKQKGLNVSASQSKKGAEDE